MPMTEKKLHEVLDEFENHFQTSHLMDTLSHKELHVYEMIPRLRVMIDEGDRREKVMRWLGFMQGFFWERECYSLDELKRMNKPDGKR